jgi:hypothetical protein
MGALEFDVGHISDCFVLQILGSCPVAAEKSFGKQ